MPTLRELANQAIAAGRTHSRARADVARMHDDRLSAQGNEDVRYQAAQKATRAFQSELAALRQAATNEENRLLSVSHAVGPNLTDAAALLRQEQGWRNNVLPLLDAGESLSVALGHADMDAVHGAARFAPTYLRAKGFEVAAEAVAEVVLRRQADLLPAQATVLLEAASAQADTTLFSEVVSSVEQGDQMTAGIIAAQFVSPAE
jgi:hypothetical protein